MNKRIDDVKYNYMVFSSIDTKKYQTEVVKYRMMAVNRALLGWLNGRNADEKVTNADVIAVERGIAEGMRELGSELGENLIPEGRERQASIEEITDFLYSKVKTDDNKKALGAMINNAISERKWNSNGAIPFLESVALSYGEFLEKSGNSSQARKFNLIFLRRDKMYYPTGRDVLIKNLNDAVRKCLRNYNPNGGLEKGFADLQNALSDAIKRHPEKCLDYIVDNFLKKSLRRESIASDLKVFLRELRNGKTNSGMDFFKGLLDDFNGEKQNARSILYKNLPIQPIKSPSGAEGEVMLSVSGNLNPSGKKKNYKVIDKESIRKFLLDYANLDDEARKDMRRRLCRLVVLYFYGLDEAGKTGVTDFFEFEDHEKRRANKELLVDVSGLTDQGYENEVKNLIHARNSGAEGLFATAESGILSDDGTLFFKDGNMNLFWIRRISSELEKVTKGIKPGKQYMLEKGYVSEKVWKGLINYLSVKYVAIGKSVYQFTLDGITDGHYDGCGSLDPELAGGISSFQLERIKAEETLQREVAVSVAFASRHLQNATVNISEKNSDFLMLNDAFDKEDVFKDRAHLCRDILQFFGGMSKWEGFAFPDSEAGKKDADIVLLRCLKKCVFALRNETFHFKTKNHEVKWDKDLIGKMFEHDCEYAVSLDRDRFYSNNLPMFFTSDDLEKVLNRLYEITHERASQVPAFGTVFVRSKFRVLLEKEKLFPDSMPQALRDQYLSTVYYLLKEIYYNDFLQNGHAQKLFYAYLDSRRIRREEKKGFAGKFVTIKDDRPLEDFKGMAEAYRFGYSFSELCQAVMTEYNQQNNQGRKKQSAYDVSSQTNKFRHYVDLLHDTIMGAFFMFLKEESQYAFIFMPKTDGKMPKKEEFLSDYRSSRFETLVKALKDNPDVQKWYVTARLLSPRQVNLLSGSLRSYKQYTLDVAKRSLQESSPLKIYDGGDWRSIQNCAEDFSGLLFENFATVLQIVDVCTQLNGSIAMVNENDDVSVRSKTILDYFDGENAYAKYLSNYLDFGQNKVVSIAQDDGYANLLAAFSLDFAERHGMNPAIYHDGTNPILNRNIVLSKLYGDARVVRESVGRVNEDILEKYLEAKEEIAEYIARGYCETPEEQRKLKKYQSLKNCVEFRNVVEYDEILNELQGQLVNWAYIRERDLMYFQLGFHYTCLHNAACKKTDDYQCIDADETKTKINNAVLYQFTALYVNGLPFYYRNDKGEFVCSDLKKPDVSNAAKESGELIGKYLTRYLPEAVYNAGLELFENVDEHDNVIALRNYIDHFHFFIDGDRSMMDLYSEVFDRFFSYDSKFRKNIANLFCNILLSHFVKAQVRFEEGEKQVGFDKKDGTRAVWKKAARLRLSSLEADEFTFKLGKPGSEDSMKCKVYARDAEFLNTVARMLTLVIKSGESDQNVRIIDDRCGWYEKRKGAGSVRNDNYRRNQNGNGHGQGGSQWKNNNRQNGGNGNGRR